VETLGEKLRTAREKKGYTFEQIGRDTNIAKRYLEALEAEDFAQFPGEPYLLGFLRNYGEYLGLDTQELGSLYKTIKIQEQPIPVEQLLKDPPRFPWPLVAGLALLLVVGGVVFTVVSSASRRGAQTASAPRPAVEYTVDADLMEKRLYRGDSVLISRGADKFKVVLAELGAAVLLSSPGGETSLDLGQEGEIDLNGDDRPDLKVFVADFFKNDPAKGASLRFEIQDTEPLPPEGATAAVSDDATTAAQAAPQPPMPSGAAGTAPLLLSSPNPYPFTLQATFKGYCMFRWESDRKERDERYFHKAEVLNVQAQNGIRLWISNASAVKMQVIGGGRTVDVELGGPGEVVVADLKWIKEPDGRFKLTTVQLD